MAAELVPTGATVLLDAGSTCLALGRLLLARPDVTLITHSLPLAALACQGDTAARVICLGGELRLVSGALVGALALSWLAPLRADWCFVSASGLTNEGASTTELAEAAMKQELLKRSGHPVLLADARKWNRAATVQFAAWRDLEIWISDAPEEAAREIEKQGPRIACTSSKNPPSSASALIHRKRCGSCSHLTMRSIASRSYN